MIGLESLLLAGLLAPGTPAAPPLAVPAARSVSLEQHLAPEQPTVFLFFKPSSSLERDFVRGLRGSVGAKVGLREIYLRNGDEPLARRYQVTATPTALVYDRRRRLVGRSSTAAEILALTARAAQVMRIDWAEPADPRFAEMERVLGRPANSGIMRTMSLRPEWMRKINELHRIEHAPDTALDRRTKEMIATYVSALNKCRF